MAWPFATTWGAAGGKIIQVDLVLVLLFLRTTNSRIANTITSAPPPMKPPIVTADGGQEGGCALAGGASLLLIVGAVLSFIGNFLLPIIGTVGLVLFLLGLIWLGLGVWSYRQPVTQPELPTNAVRA